MKDSQAAIERHELEKVMSIKDFFAIGFGAMVGVGWVVVVGDWVFEAGGPLGAIIAFILGGVMLLPITFAYGEMTASMPVAGGEIAFTYRAFGKHASYFTGWFLAFAYTMLCPWEAIAIGKLVGNLLPFLKVLPLYEVLGFTIYGPLLLISLVVSIAVIWMNIVGMNKAAAFQTFLTYFLMGTSALFIVTGIFRGSIPNAEPLIGGGKTNGNILGGIIAVLALTPFFFAGFDTIPQAAEESHEGMDLSKLGRVLSMAVFAGIVFYGLAILAVSMVMPWEEMVNLDFPAADAIKTVSPLVGNVVLLGALAGLLTTFNSFFIASTRLLFGMGRSRLLPEIFGRVSQNGAPIAAIIFVGVLTLIGPFIGSALISSLIECGSLAFMLAWLLVCMAAVQCRRTMPNMPRPFKMPGGTAMGYLSIVVSIIFVSVLVIPGSPGALGTLEWIIFGAWGVLGLLFYLLKGDASITEEERAYLLFGDFHFTEKE